MSSKARSVRRPGAVSLLGPVPPRATGRAEEKRRRVAALPKSFEGSVSLGKLAQAYASLGPAARSLRRLCLSGRGSAGRAGGGALLGLSGFLFLLALAWAVQGPGGAILTIWGGCGRCTREELRAVEEAEGLDFNGVVCLSCGENYNPRACPRAPGAGGPGFINHNALAGGRGRCGRSE